MALVFHGLQWDTHSLLYTVIVTTMTKQQTSIEHFNTPNKYFWWLIMVSLFYSRGN